MENNNDTSDRFTYGEKRTINVGNYESIEVFANISSNLKKYNLVDKTVEIFHAESCTIDEEKEAFTNTALKTMDRVRKVLNMRELKIRNATMDYTDFQGDTKFRDASCYKTDKK